MKVPAEILTQRLLSKRVIDDEGCWIWQGALGARGYGIASDGTRTRGTHRISYELFVGPIADGLTVDHLCFNPPCFNPEHLRLLTPSENSRNQRSTFLDTCGKGHEYTPENTYRRKDDVWGRRVCRTCQYEAVARYRAKRRSQRTAA